MTAEIVDPIAIVGLSCRLPGAPDVQRFWCNLRDGVDALSVLPDSRLLAAGVAPGDVGDPRYVKVAGLIADLEGFDDDLFGMTPAQARACDPQVRLFIEVAHAAIEHAGYDVTSIAAGTGVFGSAGPNRYAELVRASGLEGAPDGLPFTDAPDAVAAQTCAVLDLRGPAVTTAAGASSSLVSVHLAAQALSAGECDVAVAGGAYVQMPYGHGYLWNPGDIRSPDGRCRAFDAAAAGTVFASGAACVVLKRLSDAVADGDRISAVIAGGAVGHRGAGVDIDRTDVDRAADTIADALLAAGCAGDELSFVEADGTGIAARDRLEVTALAHAVTRMADDPPPVASIPLGSVKPNIGHLAWAAGGASLIKVVLALTNELIPPPPAGVTPHPGLRLDDTPFTVTNVARPWPRVHGNPRRAAVHTQGMVGADACLIVADGPSQHAVPSDDRPRIVVWSASSAAGADEARARLADHLATTRRDVFAAAVGTLQRGRSAHRYRAAVVCATADEAVQRMRAGVEAVRCDLDGAGVTMAFPDTSAFGPGVGVGLYGPQRVFTETMDVWIEAFERRGIDVYDRWLGEARRTPSGPERTAITVAVECALALTWASWGVEPAALRAHGAGEIAAAVITGDLALDDAVALVADGATPAGARPDDGNGAVIVLGPSGASTRRDRLVVPSLDAGGADGQRTLLAAAALLWTHGIDIHWAAVEPDTPLQRVPLPGYPYQRRRHWLLPPPSTDGLGVELARSQAATPPEPERLPERLPEPARPVAPLGRVQHAFWVLEQLVPDSGVSNIAIAIRVAQPLRWWPLHTAVNHLVARHPSLRLRFPTIDGVPVVHLTAPDDAEIAIDSRVTTEEALVGELQALIHAPFDLARDLPFRAGHFTLPDGSSVVCLAAHHIVIDAPAVQILVEELGRIYDAAAHQGRVPEALAGTVPMLDEPDPSAEDMRFWLEYLRGVDPDAMILPGARPSPANPTFAGHTCSVQVSDTARRALDRLRDELRVTDNIILLSAFCLTLLRHGAGPGLVVGVPVGRRRPGTQHQVGYGVSTMALRIHPDPDGGFRDLVRRTADAFLSGVEHAEVTVEAVLTERGHETTDWRVPLFRHMFNYRPWTDDRIRINGQVPDYIEDLFARSRLDLQCIAVPEPDRFTLRAWHSTEVHDERQVADLLARMQAALEEAAADPDRPIAQLPLRTAADGRVVAAVNHTTRRWAPPDTLLQTVAAHAEATPHAPAVVDGVQTVTYAQLVARAAAIRDLLTAAGIGHTVRASAGQPAGGQDVVALALGRSASMAAAVLGVWAAGAAYLPLDTHHPHDRLGFIVEDADARAVITDGPAPGWAEGRTVVRLDGVASPASAVPLTDGDARAADVAYVIYTSGSTGRPKGVMVTHANLANVVRDFAERLALDASGSVAWSTTTAFDISALELLLPLHTGGTVVVAGAEVVVRPRAFLDLVANHDVAVVQATPTVWRLILEEAGDELAGRAVLCGGEPLPAALARRLIATGAAVHNVYGPTETTIWSTVAELREAPDDPVTIGRPIANTRVFVVDERGHEVPPGVPGELCIAGAGVSAGYWRRPELIAERFGRHPDHGRFYRTGDRVCLRADGTLDMRGRLDRQLKLRGHRIEPAEVEAVLEEHPEVTAAAVALEGDPLGDGLLRAVVQTRSAVTDSGRLAERLGQWTMDRLPDYAVPSDVLVVDRLPTTPNGKVDYGALPPIGGTPSPERDAAAAQVAGDPRLTAQLVAVWRETLGRPGLGEHDNLFLNGGHSLLALRVVDRVERVVGRPLPVRSVFDHPTPAALAAHLTADAGAQGQPDG